MRSVPRSVADPLGANDHNVNGTLNVLEAARRAGVRRVVYASSSSVYGDRPELPKREDQPPAPISPYAVSKAAGEQYARGVVTGSTAWRRSGSATSTCSGRGRTPPPSTRRSSRASSCGR